MTLSHDCMKLSEETVELYHMTDDVDAVLNNPYPAATIENTLVRKNWIDAVQWHLEDIIRDPDIDPVQALALKRRIDRSNQDRTDLVEEIDSFFRDKYAQVNVLPGATINTESPAWAIDRLSILALKIYHMQAQVRRDDIDDAHRSKCAATLDVLIEQRHDLITPIHHLLLDIEAGKKYMKVYRQMKMYNDPSTNPVLYGKK